MSLFRFDNHTFDPDTGELDGPRESLRLQPKPARLLAMLLAANGELVERDDIRAALWPDTNVDFDAGLNTCIRQIRTALRETGGAEDFVETLPKRGYRVSGAVDAEGEHVQPGVGAPEEDSRLTDAAAMPYVIVFIMLALGTGFLLWNELVRPTGIDGPSAPPSGRSTPPATATGPVAAAPARLAVLPFTDPDGDDPDGINRELSEAFVAALVDVAPQDIVVVGPTTTARHVDAGSSLTEVAFAVSADFVLHGGHRSSSGVFFVEVVLPDGGHLFARRFESLSGTPTQIAAEVVPGMTESILEARRR